jgi:hypothetical protein
MAAIDRSIYETLILESRDGKKTVDVRLGTVSIDYYEDIFSPTVTATMVITNSGNSVPKSDNQGNPDLVCMTPDGEMQSIYQGLPLRGGEKVSIKIAGNSPTNPGLDFATNPEDNLYVSSIGNVISENQRETFVLYLSSKEAIINETQNVTKKYPTSSPISASVENIIKEYIRTNKPVEIDQTSNKYGFVGNSKKPFSLLVNLASKSVPEISKGNSTAGFIFFQTKDGFFFKSLDSLITQEPKASYTYTEINKHSSERNNDFNILSYTTSKNQKLLENLRMGAFASERIVFDPSTFKTTILNFGKEEYAGKSKNLGTKIEPPKISFSDAADLDLGETTSRIVATIADIGTFDPEVSLNQNANSINYQAQSLMRYNTLFTQVLNATIPSNTNLRAGDIIECQFPKTTISKKKEFDQEQSGLYMIKALCHHFDTTGSYTSLKLIRDTFGKFGTNNKVD